MDPEQSVVPGVSGRDIVRCDRNSGPTTLSANLNSVGAVTVTTPDHVILSSTPVAIGLYDAASGKSVIVATLTNTIGVLVAHRMSFTEMRLSVEASQPALCIPCQIRAAISPRRSIYRIRSGL